MTRSTLLLLACALAACAPEGDEKPAAAAPIEVQVATVRHGETVARVRAVGETAALSSVRLGSPVAGRVTFLAVQPGDRLAAGAVAARVIPAENEAALNGFAVLEGERGLRPEERALAEGLRRRIEARDIALRAPFAAVVAHRSRNPGEQVAANDVLLELFDPRSLYVLAQIPLGDAARVRPGMDVDVQSAAGSAAGHVAAVLPGMTPQALTVPVRVALDAPPEPPLLHAPVECRITIERRPALLIPRSALLSSNAAERGVVLVAEDGRARRRDVRLGLPMGDEVEVLEGLTPGDVVLRAGQFGLADGTEIRWSESGGE